ncbi:ROK family transcriptional regulator [Paenibacillus macquariensis]|uniref:Sugar kinase of the NBD/HSP70 family, may contain an N-terminal HTH domain n=1 Tax=Paenibacillus macquariensis TaxID=948756 RepID=A0ABY1K450_9BACL|nr:ROK family transcriptional regulator [Paenibacillus macquariensis]MEC0088945.1 ROK family transcriptional regulator [Paenibacillus macquariensis]SIR23209.1 Sugar kinase of the NBD/HSP70 family, may contain an N-terminal HTH domain [Paenibacillus macquariensis]
MKHVRGNLYLMKEINRSTILSLLHREKSLSRAEIAQRTKLSATTISSLVDELIKEGFIVESGEKSSPGAGRRAISLEINRLNGFVISVGLGNRMFYFRMSNFHGEVITELKKPATTGNTGVLESVKAGIEELVKKSELQDFSMIKGMAIASPGIIDEDNGMIEYSRYLNLKDFNIVDELQASYPIPIYVINDTNAAAFAEYYLLSSPEIRNVLYVWVYDGVGAGIIINDQIISGYKGSAGEVTYMSDYLFSDTYVLQQAQKRALKHDANVVFHDIADVLEAYAIGVPWLETLMDRSLLLMGKAIAVMINLIGPEQVILDGWFIDSPKCMQKMHTYLRRLTLHGRYEPERVTTAKLGDKNYLIGATTLILHDLFKEKVLLT